MALPARYGTYWKGPFEDAVQPHLTQGVRILDVGSGRTASIPPEKRPPGCEYVGLDISAAELQVAGAGVYDEIVVADLTCPVPELAARFDLAISWQVLEHVRPLDAAVATIRHSLCDGGTFVGLLSGRFAVYALINRLLPDSLSHGLVTRAMLRNPDRAPVFPAHYDSCSASGLRRTFREFQEVTVTPFYRAAGYFAMSRLLVRLYLAYENAICRRGLEELASHYLVVARR